jgi:hypothetical protein
MKITGFGKSLPDDSRSHGLTGLFNQLAIGALRKQRLSQTCDSQWIQDSKHYRRD